MKNTKYIFLINILPPPRMIKRIDLIEKNYDSEIICWDKGGENNYEYTRSTPINKIYIEADRKNPMKRILPMVKFSNQAYNMLIEKKPNIIHVQSYDTLTIATKYKKNIDDSVKLIYEVPDIHRFLSNDKKKFPLNFLSSYMKEKEKKCLDYVDLLILTSEAYWKHFDGKINKNKMFYMPNIPDLHVFNQIETLKKNRINKDEFVVGYIGGLRYYNELEKLIEVVDEMDDVRLMFAGYEDGDRIKKQVVDKSNIEYLGKFYYDEEVAELYSKVDMIFSVYDASMENVRIALPNKLYEAIRTNIPILVAKNTYLSEVVKKYGVGLSVNHESEIEIKSAILELKNNSNLYNEIQQNCIKASKILTPEKNNEKLLSKIKELHN